MLEHYFHSSHSIRSNRRNLRRINIKTKQSADSQPSSNVCLSNGNAIQIYRLSSDNVELQLRKEFMCNIVRLEVVPSLHHDSDYVFLLDDLGRYGFWKPGEGLKETSNVVRNEETNKRYYREEMSPQEEQHFSGSAFRFDVKDTVGHIFFTIQNRLTVLRVTVKAKQGLRIHSSRSYQIPYTRFRYVNCLQPIKNITKQQQLIIGIVQEIQQKTVLKFHTLDMSSSSNMIDEESLSFKIQRVNILQFGSGENDEVMVLTYDDVSLYRYKFSQHLCNYTTKGNYGAVCYVPAEESGYKNQPVYVNLGHDLVVFTKTKWTRHGPLKLENKTVLENRGILESRFLGRNIRKQLVVSFVTTFNEVYFVCLRDEEWRLLRKIDSLSSVFSISELPNEQNSSSLVVVHSSSEACSEVSLVEICAPSILEKEQILGLDAIENIEIVDQGESLVVSRNGESRLLTWERESKKWVEHFSFSTSQAKEEVLTCRGQFVAMRSGIYKYQLQQSTQSLSLTQLVKQSNILSAVSNESYIGYYTSQGTFKFFEMKSQAIYRVRKDCTEEYLWRMVEGSDVLVSAAYSELGELRVMPVHKGMKKISLETKQLVSSINVINYGNKHWKQNTQRMLDEKQPQSSETLCIDLVIGFHSGDLEVYSLQEEKTIAKFSLGNEMVRATEYRQNCVVVYTSTRQFVLVRNNGLMNRKMEGNTQVVDLNGQYKLHQVQLSQDNQLISQLLYIPRLDRFLLTVQPDGHLSSSLSTVTQLRSLRMANNESTLSLQLSSSISMRTLFRAESTETVPYCEVLDSEIVYIAVSENVFKYDVRRKEVVKKQLHLIKEVVGVEKIQAGLLVVGVDFMDCGAVYLFDYEDLTILSTHNMGPSSHPTCIQSFLSSNRFLIRHQTFVSIFQLQTNHIITLIKSINTKTEGSTIQIHEDYSKILITDPYRYLSVWDYDLERKDFLPVSKYFGPWMINDTCWLDGSVVTADRGGCLTVLEFNLDHHNDLHKMAMTKVAQISLGQEIFTLKKSINNKLNLVESQQKKQHNDNAAHNSKITYGTASGTIGQLKTITQSQFKLLKQIQLDTLKYIDLKEQFSYEQWRRRIPGNDKLIDGSLIRYYLEEFRGKMKLSQEEFYMEVKAVYERALGQ